MFVLWIIWINWNNIDTWNVNNDEVATTKVIFWFRDDWFNIQLYSINQLRYHDSMSSYHSHRIITIPCFVYKLNEVKKVILDAGAWFLDNHTLYNINWMWSFNELLFVMFIIECIIVSTIITKIEVNKVLIGDFMLL